MRTRIEILNPFDYRGQRATVLEVLSFGSVIAETDRGEEITLNANQYEPMEG